MDIYYTQEDKPIITDNGTLYPFNINRFYRYLDVPNQVNKKDNLLKYFFGNDRSYRQGCPFDNGDIIIEFEFKDENNGSSIGHHPLSYRGPLIEKYLIIKNIFINKRDERYDIFGASESYLKHIKNLTKNLDKKYMDKVVYYHSLNERHTFSKIPKTEFFKKNKNNLVYNGVFLYN